MTTPSVKDDLLAALPSLRAFAISLCGRTSRAEDLVQEALVKAWANIGSFEPGSNMNAWLYTILRNEYYSEFRKRRHEVGDEEGRHAARLATRRRKGICSSWTSGSHSTASHRIIARP
jgi:RNA polymerase sigma-70 factor (ECF subfamily)